jgi:hypothetical protein
MIFWCLFKIIVEVKKIFVTKTDFITEFGRILTQAM